jgi:transposase
MNQKYFVGIDISKAKLDVAVMDSSMHIHLEKIIANNEAKIRTFFSAIRRKLKVSADQILVVAEHTGLYSNPLGLVCEEMGMFLWLENAFKIKKASTDMRGKSDQKDARRIAEYAVRYADKAVAFQRPDEFTRELQALTHVRSTLIEQRGAIENQLREASSHNQEMHAILKKQLNPVLKTLNKRIAEVEKQIERKVEQNPEVAGNAELLQSIPGVGKQTALMFILATGNFTLFESAKHMACYAGVVPFPNQSGVMIRRERVSKQANKHLKKLLHLAAMAATRAPGDLQDYFIRKVKEGKNKMSVINAIRNKLVHRMFSVINRQTPYIRNRQESFNEDSLNFT